MYLYTLALIVRVEPCRSIVRIRTFVPHGDVSHARIRGLIARSRLPLFTCPASELDYMAGLSHSISFVKCVSLCVDETRSRIGSEPATRRQNAVTELLAHYSADRYTRTCACTVCIKWWEQE